jgi:hypothetical protein
VNADKIEYIKYKGGGCSLLILSGMEDGEALVIPLQPSEIAARVLKAEKKMAGGKK